MKIIESIESLPFSTKHSRVAIGKWDGLHKGHQRIIKTLVSTAKKTGDQAVVISFDRHPLALFRPGTEPLQLQTIAERSELLQQMGVDVHVIIPFTKKFAALSPEEFVKNILVDGLHAREVMVGYNFMFGKNKQGNTNTLEDLCSSYNIKTTVFSPIYVDGEVVSSTKIRAYLKQGDINKVKSLLGHSSLQSLTEYNKYEYHTSPNSLIYV